MCSLIQKKSTAHAIMRTICHNIFKKVPARVRLVDFIMISLSRSETDTEVIAHLVGQELDADPSTHLKVALAKTVARLDGTWGLAVIAHEK